MNLGRVKLYWRSEPHCKFCEMAKNLLSAEGIDYEDVNLGVDMSLEYFKMVNPEVKTVPAIFIDEIFIGGFTELRELITKRKTEGPPPKADL